MNIGLLQIDYSILPKEIRLQFVEQKILECKDVDLIVLPEMWPIGFQGCEVSPESYEWSQIVLQKLQVLAEKQSVYIHCGSFLEKEKDEYFNTTYLLGPDGKVKASYKKVHLFGFQSKESEHFSSGEQFVTYQIGNIKFGLATCYDIRFPELFRKLLDAGVDAFIVCAAWPKTRIDAWQLFCRTRALENQSYLIACNGAGNDDGLELGGNSCVVDPQGKVVSTLSFTPGILIDSISVDRVRSIRRTFPFVVDRKSNYPNYPVIDGLKES